MIGLDQDDIALNMTPLVVTSAEEAAPPYRKPSVSSRKSSVNATMTTHTSTYAPAPTQSDTDDHELPLGVTDAGNQTPLLGDEGGGGRRKSAALPRVLDESLCCVLL
jgi:hypothetical protein